MTTSRVVGEAVDEDAALGELEGGELDTEPGVDLLDDAVGALPQEPADAGDQEALQRGPRGQGAEEEDEPEGEEDALRHGALRGGWGTAGTVRSR
jgi:hypothetical protein